MTTPRDLAAGPLVVRLRLCGGLTDGGVELSSDLARPCTVVALSSALRSFDREWVEGAPFAWDDGAVPVSQAGRRLVYCQVLAHVDAAGVDGEVSEVQIGWRYGR